MMHSVYWLIVLAILIFIEILTLGLTTIWFAGGALTAFVASLFFDNLLLEVILFFVVSLTLLFFTRPLVLKYFNPNRTKTNYEGVIGKNALVTITIDNEKSVGQVSVDGQEWSAKSMEGTIIAKDTSVKIKGISGTKLFVSIFKENQS